MLFSVCFYAWTAVVALAATPLLLAPPRYCRDLGRFWARTTFAILRATVGLDYRVIGRDHIPDGPVMFAAKHQSAWDTLAFAVILHHPVYILKRELVWIPIWGWLLNHSGVIAIDRGAGAKALRGMVRRARRFIDQPHQSPPIVIFPEGTRTDPGVTKPYLPGIAALYRDLDVPVVPVALNSGRFWPRGSEPHHAGTITLEFLPPIAPGLDRKTFMTELQHRTEDAALRLDRQAVADLATVDPGN